MSKGRKETPEIIDKKNFNPKNYESIDVLLENYLKKFKGKNYPLYAVIGIPGPISNNEILNLSHIPHWPKAKGEDLAKKFGFKNFIFLNDFSCNGYGIQIDLKKDEDYIIINDVTPQEGGAKTIIGPGTGLGMAFLVKDPANKYYTVGASEGGRQDFTPKTEKLFKLREFTTGLLKSNGKLSVERILSGKGLIPMYKFLLSQEPEIKRDEELGKKIDSFQDFYKYDAINEINIELVTKGLNGTCFLSRKVLELFIEVFGEFAGDISLFSLPTNGLYLAGGMSIVLEPLIKSTKIFMEHFINKATLKSFPIYLVKNGDLGLLGARECARRLLKEEK